MSEDECAVKIAVRERPLREVFKNNNIPSIIDYHSSNSNILVVDERPFVFDHVLPPTISQRELFDFLILPLIEKVLGGFNCTALAYGQTGTGKSFTMGLNPESLEGENIGMIPRCIAAFLEDNENGHKMKTQMQVSFIEIYNEKVYDLLSESFAEPIIARGYKFTGGTKVLVSNIHDGYALLNQGTKNRHVRPTKMNPQSSRSHAIFTIHIRIEIANKTTQSCLNLVDLAGSEGVRRTGHQGVALSEGVNINQGLLSIGKVLQALTHGYKVIPYRDSVLSTVLQDSLNPNSYFTLLACISPHKEDLSETLSTLRFAQGAKNLKHNPQINCKLMDYKKSKTPYKFCLARNNQPTTTPTPYKRPFSLVNSKQSVGPKRPIYHGNTFCTPNKKKNMEISKLNRTYVGLTPKEKQKIGSVGIPISFEPAVVRESLLDRYNDTSLESRASLLSLNISSSTAIDAQLNKPNTFSPIVRKCMVEMESTMKESMLKVLQSIKSNHYVENDVLLNSEPLLDEKIRNIVRQEFLTLTEKKLIEGCQSIEKKVRCELFPGSSHPFKIPDVPVDLPASKFNLSQTLHSTLNESFLNIEETVLSKRLRRSQRISLMSNSNFAGHSMNDSKSRIAQSSTMKSLNHVRRCSIRLATKKENHQNSDETFAEIATPSTSKRGRPPKRSKSRKNMQTCPVKNSIMAGYFEEESEKKTKNMKTTLAKHQKAVLEMLNSASMKELQYLPQVGLKTAFQIVTQRTLHGRFKNFSQVGKLPIWRGKAWERFKNANNIS